MAHGMLHMACWMHKSMNLLPVAWCCLMRPLARSSAPPLIRSACSGHCPYVSLVCITRVFMRLFPDMILSGIKS